MKNNVQIMTDVFKYAMTFEKYAKTWSDAIAYTDSLLETNNHKSQNALAGIEREQFTIDNIDSEYSTYKNNAKKDIRKSRKICLIILIATAIAILSLVISLLLNQYELFAVLFYVLSPFLMGLGPIIIIAIIGYNLYKAHKRKMDFKKLNPQNSLQQKNIAMNNINSYKSFLENTKNEKNNLLRKKNSILVEYKKSRDILKQIYSLGLIPERYQGLVQTATIYGYLHNGICTNILGHGGVYERYENDLQFGEIVHNLNTINQKLDIVIKNQNKLYDVLCSVDSTLREIKREVEHSNELLSDIKSNSAIAATAAAQSAAANSYIANAVWSNS